MVLCRSLLQLFYVRHYFQVTANLERIQNFVLQTIIYILHKPDSVTTLAKIEKYTHQGQADTLDDSLSPNVTEFEIQKC